jgi:hypothetical protein
LPQNYRDIRAKKKKKIRRVATGLLSVEMKETGGLCINGYENVLEHVLYPEPRLDDRMPAGRSDAGYRKEVPDNNKMTSRPRMDTSTTRVSYRVSVTIWPIEQRG